MQPYLFYGDLSSNTGFKANNVSAKLNEHFNFVLLVV